MRHSEGERCPWGESSSPHSSAPADYSSTRKLMQAVTCLLDLRKPEEELSSDLEGFPPFHRVDLDVGIVDGRSAQTSVSWASDGMHYRCT